MSILINDAIIALGGSNCSVQDIDTIHWSDGNPKNITKEQIQAKYDELVEADKKIQYQRDRAVDYPSIGDQLDMLFHAIDAGKVNKTSEFYKALKAVKDKHPKG